MITFIAKTTSFIVCNDTCDNQSVLNHIGNGLILSEPPMLTHLKSTYCIFIFPRGCRMVGRRDEESSEAMIDVTYRQSAGEREVVAVLQKLYLCASVEFLMAVADFFLQALPQSLTPTTASAPSDRLPLRQTTEPRADAKTSKTKRPKH